MPYKTGDFLKAVQYIQDKKKVSAPSCVYLRILVFMLDDACVIKQ
jgi:hypothetical protein